MGWRDLLTEPGETFVYPWTGSRSLYALDKNWKVEGNLPAEFGWYWIEGKGRRRAERGEDRDGGGLSARIGKIAQPDHDLLAYTVTGYLCGDRFIPDGSNINPDPAKIHEHTDPVFLIEEGLEPFCRVRVGKIHPNASWVYMHQEMPTGPEDEVTRAFEDRLPSVSDIRFVSPGLDAAFRMASWQRAETERRRAELERLRREEAERRAREERRRQLAEQMGTGAGRREMARMDFGEAAKAALMISGAELLSERNGARRGEHVVRFRFMHRRFECVCDDNLRIIEAGLCLNAHFDDPDFEEGTRGDTWLTLESLPGIYRQAMQENRLVLFRHVDY